VKRSNAAVVAILLWEGKKSIVLYPGLRYNPYTLILTSVDSNKSNARSAESGQV
jgi:hypothetical protein